MAYKNLDHVAAKLQAARPDLTVSFEDGMMPSIEIKLKDGSYLVFGDAGDFWGADLDEARTFFSDVPTSDADVDRVAEAALGIIATAEAL